MSLLDFYKLHLLKEKYSALHEHALFMIPFLGVSLFADFFPYKIFHTKNKIRTKISDENIKNNSIATTYIKPNIDELLSKKQTMFSL